MSKVLLIDDEDKLRTLLSRIILLEGFEVIQAADCKTALKKAEQYEIDIIVCDVKLPDGNGIELSKKLKLKVPFAEIILLTAYGNIADGVQAIKNGAFDYITKGDDNNKIIPLLYKAAEKVQLSKRLIQLEKRIDKKYSFDSIIGKSRSLTNAIVLAQKVAITDTSVLLLGETGTGKELFAQAIHQSSNRNTKNFVAINCSAFSKELLESELFGHVAGAFTGAAKDKKGLFEEANHGSIFLDEIGEMSTELQAKILRVLESGEFIKVGDIKPTRVNVRIIAATNRNLEEEIKKDNFRNDLFYRISVFSITLPPLRERKDDIRILAGHFAEIFALKSNLPLLSLSDDYIKALENNEWKGNIRELKNVIERSVILSESGFLELNTLPFEIKQTQFTTGTNHFSMAGAEKLHIQKVLNHTQGNKAEAARLLEIGIATLYRKIEEYHI